MSLYKTVVLPHGQQYMVLVQPGWAVAPDPKSGVPAATAADVVRCVAALPKMYENKLLPRLTEFGAAVLAAGEGENICTSFDGAVVQMQRCGQHLRVAGFGGEKQLADCYVVAGGLTELLLADIIRQWLEPAWAAVKEFGAREHGQEESPAVKQLLQQFPVNWAPSAPVDAVCAERR